MSTPPLELGNLCRTCMTNRAKFTPGASLKYLRRSIFQKPRGWSEGPTIMDLLRSVQPHLEIHIKDKLPKIMCTNCIEKLLMTYEFLEMCRDTDMKYRKILNENRNDEPRELLDPVEGFIVTQVECSGSNEDASAQQPEFEAMFIKNWSGDDDDGMDFSDNPFGNDSNDDDDDESCDSTSMEKSNRKTLGKRRRSSTNISSKHKPSLDENNCSTQDAKRLLKYTSKNGEPNVRALTEEIQALRTEVRKLRSLGPEADTSLLQALPFLTLADFKEFDARLLTDDDLRFQLINMIHRVGGKEFPNFLRTAMRSVIKDELAVILSWRGMPEKPSFKTFSLYAILKDICYSKYPEITDVDINKICQQHLLHAKDRIHSRKKTAST